MNAQNRFKLKSLTIKSLTVFLLIIAVGTLSSNVAAQSYKKPYKHMGKTCEYVDITDSGEMYSTYELDDDEIELLKKSVKSEAIVDDIMELYHEDSWPEAIATLDGREENRDDINDLNAYVVGKFSKTHYIVVIPAKRNKSCPAEMRPKTHIYFIIGKEGLDI